MQTFLPYPDFRQSLECLDTKRLGKQRVEALQLVRAIENPNAKGWKNHPACRMWQGYVNALKLYHDISIQVWIERGYRNTMPLFLLGADAPPPEGIVSPPWLGDEAFHRSHQSNLLRKFPEHYATYFLDCPHDLPYVWPV